MQFKYSKPYIDVSPESTKLSKIDGEILNRQSTAARYLKSQPVRERCLLCHAVLQQSNTFNHRELDYFLCTHCYHIQSYFLPTKTYPTDTTDNMTFLDVYPKLSPQEYNFRKNRIYQPKRDWIIDSITHYGLSLDTLRVKKWCELGTGAGYFLSTLQELGINNIMGVEHDKKLCDIANTHLKQNCIIHFESSLAQAISSYESDVYVAFFVLEHVPDAGAFFEAMGHCQPGTIFIFSVPIFSFSTLLETAFSCHAGRNLDNALHTQLYTEDSIQFAMKKAGLKIINQWLFGQDASDLTRLLMLKLENNYPPYLINQAKDKLNQLIDPIQQNIDVAQFCDARHIICIKD